MTHPLNAYRRWPNSIIQDPGLLRKIMPYTYDINNEDFLAYHVQRRGYIGFPSGPIWDGTVDTTITKHIFLANGHEPFLWQTLCYQRGCLQDSWELFTTHKGLASVASLAYAAPRTAGTWPAQPSSGDTMSSVTINGSPELVALCIALAAIHGGEVAQAAAPAAKAAAPVVTKEQEATEKAEDAAKPDISSAEYQAMFSAIQDFIGQGKDEAKAIVRTLLGKLGVERISEIPAAKYAVVTKTVNNQVAKLPKAPAPAADDDLLG